MKKALRLISLLLAVSIVFLTLSGCEALDEARLNHGFWVDEENTVVTLNGVEYKLLPGCEYLRPVTENSSEAVYITEPDVPVLLKDMFGEDMYRSDDGYFLTDEYSYDYTYRSDNRVYCRTDKYDDVCAQITSGPLLDRYCYSYDEYIQGVGDTFKTYILTEEQTDAVDIALSVGEKITASDYSNSGEYILELYACSDDGVFREYYMDLMFKNGTYYLVYETNPNYYTDETNQQVYCVVPEEYAQIFYDILEPAVSA